MQEAPMKKPRSMPAARKSIPSQTGPAITAKGHVFHKAAPMLGGFKLNVLPDLPDLRDRLYEPLLSRLRPAFRLDIPSGFARNQGASNACTGFALAHVVDALRLHAESHEPPSSAMMLYHMAKLNDEWSGTDYEGSSIRGALKGFHNYGVCAEAAAPFDPRPKDWLPDVEQSRAARSCRLGAYYRLRPEINDYHAALNEVGAIYVSAVIHKGWAHPRKDGREGPSRIPSSDRTPSVGGHAFAVVGYDDEGFIVLNSWGGAWGDDGTAHWSYADWAATVVDAWVLQMAVTAPSAAGLVARQAITSDQTALFGKTKTSVLEINGHFINIDDGVLQKSGPYPTADMTLTGPRITDPAANDGKGYQHLVIYCHGGLNALADEAARIARMKPVFKRYGIYNLHLMWGTDFFGELFQKVGPVAHQRMGGIFSEAADIAFEVLAMLPGGRVWRHIKEDAANSFAPGGPFGGGVAGLSPVLDHLVKTPGKVKVHIVAHSAGAILAGHLLAWLKTSSLKALPVDAVHLMAPACTTGFLRANYAAAQAKGTKIHLYNLTGEAELDDSVGLEAVPLKPYNKSLLYLVSNAFEAEPGSLAGMEAFKADLPAWSGLGVDYADANGKATSSTTHGGFDNDGRTLTTIVSRILGKPAKPPVQSGEL
jgi:hypothetical protein